MIPIKRSVWFLNSLHQLYRQYFLWGKEEDQGHTVTYEVKQIMKSNAPQRYSARTIVDNDERLRQNHFICDPFRFETKSQFSS
jgi:hypothetical protein